jgi:tripartite-type tricarboxylate transporter receptor subunit TctC
MMHILLKHITSGLALILICSFSYAQTSQWPTKPIKYVVPFAPGGVSDSVSRLIAQNLSVKLGQPVIIENKAGVSGILGTQYVARSVADGYTIMGGTITTHAVNPFFTKNLGYEPVKDFAPINLIGTVSNVLVIPSSSRFNSVQQIIDELKNKPNSLTYGTAGAGTSQHLSGQLFQSITNTQMRQIIYKGGSQAMIDLVGGQIDMVFETVAAAKPMIDAKRVKVLAVTSKNRLTNMSATPSLAELGVTGFEMQSWQGVFAPTGTPKVIVDRLSSEIAQIVDTPEIKEKLRSLGVEPDGRSSDKFSEFQIIEISKWGKVIKDAGIQAE